jgi:hypothetical protein
MRVRLDSKEREFERLTAGVRAAAAAAASEPTWTVKFRQVKAVEDWYMLMVAMGVDKKRRKAAVKGKEGGGTARPAGALYTPPGRGVLASLPI